MRSVPKNNLVFLICAYNEESRIDRVISSIFSAGYTEVVVVNDGSSDATGDILDTKFANAVHRVHHILNRGYGAAMRTGFAYIVRHADEYNWKYVVTLDADGQMDVADVEVFCAYYAENQGAEIIFGSRFIEKTQSNVPWYRKVVLFGGRIFTALISRVYLTDAHNGYRFLSIDILKKMRLTMDGMEFSSELIDEIVRLGETIHEVPVNIHYDEYTLAKGQRFGGVLRIASKMIFKKFF